MALKANVLTIKTFKWTLFWHKLHYSLIFCTLVTCVEMYFIYDMFVICVSLLLMTRLSSICHAVMCFCSSHPWPLESATSCSLRVNSGMFAISALSSALYFVTCLRDVYLSRCCPVQTMTYHIQQPDSHGQVSITHQHEEQSTGRAHLERCKNHVGFDQQHIMS